MGGEMLGGCELEDPGFVPADDGESALDGTTVLVDDSDFVRRRVSDGLTSDAGESNSGSGIWADLGENLPNRRLILER